MAYNPNSNVRMDPQVAAERAVSVIGFGYDLTSDIRLSACKPGPSGSGLIEMDRARTKELVVPGNVVVSNVSASIKCDKGERTRFSSDALSFNQIKYDLQTIRLKLLTMIIGFCSICSDVGAFQPGIISVWFIEKYGTHVIVGVKMGGKDVIHIKQLQNSNLQPAEVQKLLKQLADERFCEDGKENLMVNPGTSSGKPKVEQSMIWDLQLPFASTVRPPIVSHSKTDDLLSIHIRRGGVDTGQSHNQWLSTVSQYPNVISMSFVPIASLLSGIRGSGFLSHAINLYLRYKPPLEELTQFLEYQLPRQWAPAYNDLPLGPRSRKKASPALQFTLLGPKLYVNTVKVDTGKRPVTGIRLYLEGKRSDHLAIHLQHLSTLPQSLQLSSDNSYEPHDESIDRGYFEPVKWSIFSHICTAPVEYHGARIDDSASIVTKAWFETIRVGRTNKRIKEIRIDFHVDEHPIQLCYESTPEAPKGRSELSRLSWRTTFAARAPKMSHFVDTKEMVRGPEDPPGYWVATGAKLCVENGMIRIKVKYSLLTIVSDESLLM
ncbi:UNVERIFIED_CONTAM: MACPF domain-containing protein NSL1 [Sesamum radiatum]|uniref:MACPF domain-containing protein NSL1 n=1 Tax=Sesamum radiatum TaxID=300843 RepID=A0AAW2T200_SESRA